MISFSFEGNTVNIYDDNSIHIGGMGFNIPATWESGKIEWDFATEYLKDQINEIKKKTRLIEEIERRLKLMAFT